jgi:RNA polymerase sigma factor (sigma-70 family)
VFNDFYRATHVSALRTARRVAGPRPDWAADAVQSAYEVYWKLLPERGEDFRRNRNYLLTIVVNNVNQMHRDAKREILTDEDISRSCAGEDDAVATNDHVLRILRDLPIALRTVAVLAFELEMTAAEIAAFRGTSRSTVRTQLQRLRELLGAELGLERGDRQ